MTTQSSHNVTVAARSSAHVPSPPIPLSYGSRVLPPRPLPDGGLRIVLSHVYAWPEVRRGGERYLHELAAALAGGGHRVTILTSAPTAGRRSEMGVPVVAVRRREFRPSRYSPLADEIAFGMQAAAYVAPKRIDVWHALGTADAAAAAQLGRVRPLRSIHTNLGIPNRSYRDQRPDRRLHQIVVDRIDAYVCLSNAAAAALKRDYGRDGTVLGGGVDLDRFAPAPARSPRPALLFSGSLTEPRKGLALLLEAVGRLLRRRPDLELWLSGPGDPAPLLAAASPEGSGAVVNLGLGQPEDQPGRYGRAWVTVLPSVDEAFGLVLVESLACGTPVVALATGGGPTDVVRPGTGVLASAAADGRVGPEELAAACDAALELAAEDGIAERCRAVAREYDWASGIAPRMVDAYLGQSTSTR